MHNEKRDNFHSYSMLLTVQLYDIVQHHTIRNAVKTSRENSKR